MDREANQREQRELAREILAVWDQCDEDGELTIDQAFEVAHYAQRLAELVDALAEWESQRQR